MTNLDNFISKYNYLAEDDSISKNIRKEYRQLADWLKELKQLKEQIRWIPVSEKLPNFNDIVLASTESDYDDELRVIIMVYCAEYFWFDGKIKAWMPLPEPYKDIESEE